MLNYWGDFLAESIGIEIMFYQTSVVDCSSKMGTVQVFIVFKATEKDDDTFALICHI